MTIDPCHHSGTSFLTMVALAIKDPNPSISLNVVVQHINYLIHALYEISDC